MGSLITVHVHNAVDEETKGLLMSLNEKVDEVKAIVASETEQSAARDAKLAEAVAKIVELQAKVDVLLSDTYSKAEVNAAFDEIKALVPAIVKDEQPVEPPVE